MADDEPEDDDPDEGAPPVDPRLRVWTAAEVEAAASAPPTPQERAQFGIPNPVPPAPPRPKNDDQENSVSPRNVLVALVEKFPDFDPTWPPKTQAAWFASFEQLMKAGLK